MTLRFFFFNDTATTEIYTLSLHDALPISAGARRVAGENDTPSADRVHGAEHLNAECGMRNAECQGGRRAANDLRSEEHTSELQSRLHLVCRLLLEKKKQENNATTLRHRTL